MAITPEFLDQIRNRIAISTIVGARVKLQRKGNRYWGCCPFHNEKTPSFTVSDDKEFYHCFGCSEHGDIISFVMKTQGITFVEAIRQLSAQAGLQMPTITPEQRQNEEKKLSLYEVCELACNFFQKNLYSGLGQPALSYLKNRGLTEADMHHFRLGYSPNSTAFLEYMQSKNIDETALIDAGLARKSDTGLYAFFRNRLMFPIADTRGRVLAFGGRFMGDEKQANIGKYVNSPQGILYDKSRVLYNLKNARESAYKQNRLVVCEGYMDVIALTRAGFNYAIAPCGTAMTEEQLLQCWKTVDEPILCFDGDSAGQKAALRTCERALPLLKAGKSVNMTIMPSGQDPDDIVRTQGAVAMGKLLDNAVSLRDFLWQHATTTHPTDTPERLAKLEKYLMDWAYSIPDKTVSGAYYNTFKNLIWNTYKTNNKKARLTKTNTAYLQNMRLSDKQQMNALACLINHPMVLANVAEQCQGFFDHIYEPCFQSACDGVYDGIHTTAEMLVHLTDSGHGDMVISVCTNAIYMLGKSAHPKASDTEAESHIHDILKLHNMNLVKDYMQQFATDMAKTDNIGKLEQVGEDYRAQEQQLYDMDNWD